MQQQIDRRPAAELQRAQVRSGSSQRPASARESLHVRSARIDDRKLEPLGLVHRHQAHAVAALFEDRRLGRLRRSRRPRAARRRSRGTTCRRRPRTARASSATCSTLASACSPRGAARSPTCARVALEQLAAIVSRRPAGSCAAGAAAQQRRAPRRSAQMRELVEPSASNAAGTRNGCRWHAKPWASTDRIDAVHSSSSSSPMAKSGPRSVANTDSSSSGHSIAASAARIASTSSRSWNALPPTSTCGMPRASSASTYGRVTSFAEADEAAEQQADVLRGDRRRGLRRSRSVTVQPLSLTQPVDERADGVGQRLLDRPGRGRTARCRTARAPAARRPPAGPSMAVAMRRERHVVGLQRECVAGHDRRERGVHDTPGSPARCGSSCVRCTTCWRPRCEPLADLP